MAAQHGYIFGTLRQIGIEDEDDRRDLFERVTGKRSLRAMSWPERNRLIDELKKMTSGTSQAKTLTGPFAKKLQALWIACWNLGLINDKSDAALLSFVKRQCGIVHMQWLRDPHDAEKVVEALKSMIAREAGVNWSNTSRVMFMSNQAAKIAWAIWCKLHPEAQLADLAAFEARLGNILKRPVKTSDLTMRDWQMVGNALGVQWRRTKQ